jgi:hypothetical protein
MSTRWKRTVTQVVWQDLEPWVQQLYEDHGVCIRFLIGTPPPGSGLNPVVRLIAYKPLPKGEEDVIADNYQVINPTAMGSTESAAIRLASALLLELERAEDIAMRQQPLFA